MFCPNCSQKQISDDIKFCKNCGFPLSDVSEALKNDGYVERNTNLAQYVENISQYTKELKKNVTKGVVVMTVSLIFFILSLILGTPEPPYAVQFNLLVGVLIFMTGLVLIGSSFFKKPEYKPEQEKNQPDLLRQPRLFENQNAALLLNEKDASEFINVKTFETKRLKSEQAVESPPSVVERTTKLLNKEE